MVYSNYEIIQKNIALLNKIENCSKQMNKH